MANNERNISLDFIRALSLILVIATHTFPKPLADNLLFTSFFNMFLYTCNSNFYMLSGQLNLKKKFETPQDYKIYYLKKVSSIAIPYIIATCILTLWTAIADGEKITFASYFEAVYADIMWENITIHLWYMYPLIGMLISAPFLSKMLHNMKNEELHILFGVAIAWNIVSIFFTKNIGVGFTYLGWLLSDWILFFFLGYYSSRVITSENKKKWYFAGFICLLINVLGMYLMPANYNNPTDLAVPFVIWATAVFAFWQQELVINNKIVKAVIQFLAKHSFMAYMIHWNVCLLVTPKIVTDTRVIVYFLESLVLTFTISLLLAVVIDVCLINPIQKVFKKKFLQ